MRTRTVVIISAAAVLVLAAASTIAIGATRSHHDDEVTYRPRSSSPAACSAPNLPGTIVNVTLTNAGGPMMGGAGGGPMMGGLRGGMMRLTATPTSASAGQVSFVATNTGSVNHELVILALPTNEIVGTRTVRADGTIDETGNLGEASNSCGAGGGDGIAPGASSWVTIALTPGRYELVCNLPGHYAAGMYSQLTVR